MCISFLTGIFIAPIDHYLTDSTPDWRFDVTLLGSPELVSNLVAWKNLNSYRGIAGLLAWLLGLCVQSPF